MRENNRHAHVHTQHKHLRNLAVVSMVSTENMFSPGEMSPILCVNNTTAYSELWRNCCHHPRTRLIVKRNIYR